MTKKLIILLLVANIVTINLNSSNQKNTSVDSCSKDHTGFADFGAQKTAKQEYLPSVNNNFSAKFIAVRLTKNMSAKL